MKPKDKAEELIKKMHACGGYGFEIEDAIECALVAVNEIKKYDNDYWKQVLSEITKFKTQ